MSDLTPVFYAVWEDGKSASIEVQAAVEQEDAMETTTVRDLQEQRQRRAARRMAMQMIALQYGWAYRFSWCRYR